MKEARPTSGRVLLALFSILGPVEGTAFLDLFAGTGRIGMEALKRGASSVTLVETISSRARSIESAIPQGQASRVTVLSLELRRALAWLTKRELHFDVVFADPPYGEGWSKSLLQIRGLEKVVAPEGILVVEHASREPLQPHSTWEITDVRAYGETTLTFLKVRSSEAFSASV